MTDRNARHGMVIGKFYPPHAGHHRLIDVAAACSDRLTVLVCDQQVETIPGPLRTAWVADAHRHHRHVSVVHTPDGNPVDFDDPAVWDLHMAAFRAALERSGHRGTPVDAVFSSESYGAELARRLGATAVEVDLERSQVAVSGTAVRADPIAHWDLIDGPVRAWFARRVAILDPGSTGGSSVASGLAERLRRWGGPWGRTRLVADYGRELLWWQDRLAEARAELVGESTDAETTRREMGHRALVRQLARTEDAAAADGGPVLVCDIDGPAAKAWVGLGYARPSEVAEPDEPASHALYLVNATSEGGPAEEAEELVEILRFSGAEWRWLQGPLDERVDAAEVAVDDLVGRGWHLADPLG